MLRSAKVFWTSLSLHPYLGCLKFGVMSSGEKLVPKAFSIYKLTDGPSQVKETTLTSTSCNFCKHIVIKSAFPFPLKPSVRKYPHGTFQFELMETAIITTSASVAAGIESSPLRPVPSCLLFGSRWGVAIVFFCAATFAVGHWLFSFSFSALSFCCIIIMGWQSCKLL